MRWLLIFLGCILTAFAGEMDPTRALKELIEGNIRFQQGKVLHPNGSQEARLSTATGQAPFAAILGCSDSRVSPEILFDQGIGDLFVVRVAGNVVDDVGLDSLEYTTFYLKSSLILVLGHQNCGAIQAVVDGNTKDIESVASLIKPSLDLARSQKGSLLENTTKDNVLHVVDQLKKSPVLAKLIQAKKLNIVGGYYDFKSGAVEIITK